MISNIDYRNLILYLVLASSILVGYYFGEDSSGSGGFSDLESGSLFAPIPRNAAFAPLHDFRDLSGWLRSDAGLLVRILLKNSRLVRNFPGGIPA